jgi:ribonuclease P protein component
MLSFSLPSKIKLKSAARISALFEKGKAIHSKPLRGLWQIVPDEGEGPFKIAFSVSKRNFKRAIDRNLLKRRMREAFRLNNNLLHNSASETTIHLIIIYNSKKLLPFLKIQEGMINLLKRLEQELSGCSDKR